MKLKIEFDMDNAAFEPAQGFEASRILTKLSDRIAGKAWADGQVDGGPIFDGNGNRVGKWAVE